jgi:diguanylate cyclase (GGDEF)-like protein
MVATRPSRIPAPLPPGGLLRLYYGMTVGTSEARAATLARLSDELHACAWELALECVEEGIRGDAVPSLARLDRLGRLGDVPTFISELAHELGDPQPARLRRGSPLAVRAREHAREREAVGFAPREIVTEFLLLRRVLWRFVSTRAAELEAEDVFEAERRLNDTIDRLITECVVAYFDRVTAELSKRARRDPLTDLLNHQAFQQELAVELERAERYDHGLTLVFFDLDRFKDVNDTHGHLEGDRVLRRIAAAVREILRGSDLAGRMGGDEFAVLLLEAEPGAGLHFLERLDDCLARLRAAGELPAGFSVSPGTAHYPTEGHEPEELFQLADERLYAAKRAKR